MYSILHVVYRQKYVLPLCGNLHALFPPSLSRKTAMKRGLDSARKGICQLTAALASIVFAPPMLHSAYMAQLSIQPQSGRVNDFPVSFLRCDEKEVARTLIHNHA